MIISLKSFNIRCLSYGFLRQRSENQITKNLFLRKVLSKGLSKKLTHFFFQWLLFTCCFTGSFVAKAQPRELILWHGMAGNLGTQVTHLVDDFNDSQKDYVIKAVYKGDYIETLTNFAASFRAHEPPSIVQIFEVGTSMMLSPKGVIKPVDDLMREENMPLPKADFIQSVRQFYSRGGKLMAMPFNLSTPVVYYNADLLAKFGYNSSNFPTTWQSMELMARRLKKAGYPCTLTTAYPGWILFESYLAIHGLALTHANPVSVAYDTPQLTSHFKRLQRWYRLGYFRYGGRADEGTIFFTSKVCPLFSQSSGSYTGLAALVPFHLGVAPMPLDTSVSKVRHANIAGGAALWAVAGQTPEQYKGVASFFSYLARPDVQKRWQAHTGYLPLGLQGIYADIVKDSHQPVLDIAKKDLVDNLQGKPLKHYGPQNQIRSINDEVLEAMFAGLISPEKALQESALRSNRVIKRFSRNTSDL